MIVLFISMGLLSGCSGDSASSKSGASSYSAYECDYNYYNCDDFLHMLKRKGFMITVVVAIF